MFKLTLWAAAGLISAVVAADHPWRNWNQAQAFEESQRRVAAGRDPLPGIRSCFWRYGPTSGDPYLNIAYPDAGTFYWGGVFSMPQGARLHLEGRFPNARYMSLISYDFKGSPLESVADYLIDPLPGSTNPYREGANRRDKRRSYRIEVVNQPLTQPMRWGVYLEGETRDRIHAPQQPDNPQQQLQYRIYAPDRGTDETANAGLPEPVLTLADGRVLRGDQACAALRTSQTISGDPAALAMSREAVRKLVADARERLGPAGPAANPPVWSKSSEETSRFAVYTGDTTTAAGTRRRDGSFYANLDNQYLRTFISRKLGEVFVLRGKAPTTPRTYGGNPQWQGAAQLRYWSFCSNQGFGTARVNACVYDERIPVDENGNYTIVISRASDRPRNAIEQCGIAWLPMADIGDGSGEEDLTLITLRQMLGAGDFPQALHNIAAQSGFQEAMGAYFPRGRYTSVSAFETFVPCLIGKR